MAFGSRLLGALTLTGAFCSSVQANTLASANAFACGVDAPSVHGDAATRASLAKYSRRGATGAGLDPQTPSTVKLRIIYEYPDRVEIDHCGGTVIDSQWIVTAAHCVAADSSWDRVEVIAGDSNLDSGTATRRVSRNAVCHSGFEFDGLKDDVALIKLDQPLPGNIPPAQIDQQGTTSARRGSTALVAGWPVTGLKAGERNLNKTQVQLTDVQVPGYITAVSASGGPDGVCRGESGGPLLTYGSYGLQLAGVLSGIQPGTQNGQGEECVLSGYEMYFTPIAAFRHWMDNVRYLCTNNPALCSGSGSRGQLLADAPLYDGTAKSTKADTPASPAYVEAPRQPKYTPVSAQPTYVDVAAAQPAYTPVAQTQPTYINVSLDEPTYTPIAQTQPTYVPIAQTQPTYINVALEEPSYIPVAQTQPTYVPIAQTQPTYIDVSNQYASTYENNYQVATKPIYESATYEVASNWAATTVDYSTSNYVSVGNVDSYSSFTQPAAPQYQDFSFEPVAPAYIETVPLYDNVSNYEPVYSVAYATQPISSGSVFQLHAW